VTTNVCTTPCESTTIVTVTGSTPTLPKVSGSNPKGVAHAAINAGSVVRSLPMSMCWIDVVVPFVTSVDTDETNGASSTGTTSAGVIRPSSPKGRRASISVAATCVQSSSGDARSVVVPPIERNPNPTEDSME
jgi:hypothetical protein